MSDLEQLYKQKGTMEAKLEEVKQHTPGMLWVLLVKELIQNEYNKILKKIKQLENV